MKQTVLFPITKKLGFPEGFRDDLPPIFPDPTRCKRTRESINPYTDEKIALQCVCDLGHKGGHHFENPSNKRRKSK